MFCFKSSSAVGQQELTQLKEKLRISENEKQQMQERMMELEKHKSLSSQSDLSKREIQLDEQLREREREKELLQKRIWELEKQTGTPSLQDQGNQAESTKALKESIHRQVTVGLERREASYIRNVFDRYKLQGTDTVAKEVLPNAFRDLNVHQAKDDSIEELLSASATTSSLDFDQFFHIATYPSSLERVLQKIPLPNVLADAVPVKEGIDPLTVFKDLTTEEIVCMIDGMKEGLVKVIAAHVFSLRESLEALERHKLISNPGASKFCVPNMSAGKVDDFHDGIEGRVGPCNLNFEKAMCMEHCTKAGWDFVLLTTNYRITTTPKDEWEIVVERRLDKADMGHGRTIPDVSALLECPAATRAGLKRAEVIAIVLYTGPMFMVYNAILRQCPADLYAAFADGDNRYATTIHVLVSAVQKVARSARLPDGLRVYRGLGGAVDLPAHFLQADEAGNGCRGFTEWAFMSTTSNRAVALEYSGVRQGRPHASVLVLQIGAIDRGACIRDFSQYQQEIEYLWLPCSFVAPAGEPWLEMAAEGVVRMVPIRVNSNLKALTIEQMMARKKTMHLSAFNYLVDELSAELADVAASPAAEARWLADPRKTADAEGKPPPADLARGVVEGAREVLARQETLDLDNFVDDNKYRELNLAMLDALRFGRSKVEYWIHNRAEMIESVLSYSPRLAHRLLQSFLAVRLTKLEGEERREEAVRLARIRGLLASDVAEANELGEDKFMQAVADGAGARDLQLLAWAGGDVCRKTTTGLTALYIAAQGGHADTVRALVALGAGVNEALWNGVGPLWIAALNGHVDCVRALAELNADLNLPKSNGCTPLYVAAEYGRTDCVALLASLGADVDRAENVGMTAAFIAALNGHADTLRALGAARADLNRAKPNGCTPLYVAAEYGHVECVRTLLELGADPAQANIGGKTPAWVARNNGHDACAALLEQ